MSMDPFHIQDQLNPSANKDIFVKPKSGGGGGLGRTRKPEEPLEPLEIPLEVVEPEAEKPKPSVTLTNPKWEIEKVGFNEETDISVELTLPADQAHKTKVTFVLFAKTPKGPERIIQGEAHADAGKAKCRIPVFIPSYKDAEGKRLEKVEYFFTAKHSDSELLDTSPSPKVINETAERLLETHILPDLTFATDQSFLNPNQAKTLKELCTAIKAWRDQNPDGKLAVFGYADAVGKEDYNKTLSERRGKSVFAFLMKDAAALSDLDKEEKWNLTSIQDLLKFLGHDPGVSDGQDGPKTQSAVKAFQTEKGLTVDGKAGPQSRSALYQAFMDDCNGLVLKKKDFDEIAGQSHMGCSEFNLVEKADGACGSNRRVAVLFLKSNKNFPFHYPCAKGDIGPCKSQAEKKGSRRTPGFSCLFYDQLVTESAHPGGDELGSVRVGLPVHPGHSATGKCRLKIAVSGKETLEMPLESCDQGEDGLFFFSIENPKPGELYTVSIAHQDQPQRIAIKDYEFHRYLQQLLDGQSDFPRPEVANLDWDQTEDPEADGDTLGSDPIEIEDGRLAGFPKGISGQYA